MQLEKNKEASLLFQRIAVDDHLPQFVQAMGADDSVFVSGSIKYTYDFIEDVAKECNVEVEKGENYMKFSTESHAIYVDLVKNITYVSGTTLAFIDAHRDKIKIYV